MGDLGLATDLLEDEFGKLEHGELAGVAEVHRADALLLLHEAEESLDKVVDEAEGAGLRAVTVDGQIISLKGLNDEVGDDTPVIGQHARTIGVEDADDADIDSILAVVVEEESLCGTLALVVAGAKSDRVDITPVGLLLGMHGGVAVHLGGGGLEDTGLHALGETEAVDRPDHGGLHGLDGVVLVVQGRCGTGQIVDAVDLELEGVDDVMAHQFKAGIALEVLDVGLATGEEVVETDDFVTLTDQAVTEVGSEESGSTGDENAHNDSVYLLFSFSNSANAIPTT